MKLYPIQATGIRAFCSDLIVDPHDMETVYFMSICGHQATVKGIIANLLENYGVGMEVDGIEYYLIRSSLGYKVEARKLPSGAVHALLFPKLALPKNDEEKQHSFFVFTGEDAGERIYPMFFRHLDEKTEIPLHPSWAEWLWRIFGEQEEWATELETLAGGYRGYSFQFNPNQLHVLVSEAIKNKTPEIIDCMRWKGGDGDGKVNLT